MAKINIPHINTDMHLMNFPKLPFFRIVVTLGTLSDMIYKESVNDYIPADDTFHAGGYAVESEWFPKQGIVAEQSFDIAMPYATPGDLSDATTMILGIGIEFGTAGYDEKPVEVKYAECAQILSIK